MHDLYSWTMKQTVFLEKNNLSHCSFKEKGEEGDGSSANCCWDTQNTALWKIKASSDSCRFGLCLFLMLGSLSRSRTGQVGE
ncbi:uncharacterized protein LOC113062337 isoform X3 [Carassius auratus]|uniref:Uncharacterized protein LOC113062337 isoform X3 n=1 Tax=Carassius auratus TaxID=7957 RepID=A0A6P6LTV1_CARAU|nr:uncharacterized protein LOC113062337 isoform X3 [Carassius auratus]